MARYVIVSTDASDKVIKGGPILWDGVARFALPPGQVTMLESDAQANGYTPTPIPVAVTNEAALRQRAEAAITANAVYLALPSPSAAQAIAQTRLLTQQCTALIRLTVRALDTTAGS